MTFTSNKTALHVIWPQKSINEWKEVWFNPAGLLFVVLFEGAWDQPETIAALEENIQRSIADLAN